MKFICFHDSRASDFGLMKIDNKGRVLSFSEKPRGNELKAMVSLDFGYKYYSGKLVSTFWMEAVTVVYFRQSTQLFSDSRKKRQKRSLI